MITHVLNPNLPEEAFRRVTEALRGVTRIADVVFKSTSTELDFEINEDRLEQFCVAIQAYRGVGTVRGEPEESDGAHRYYPGNALFRFLPSVKKLIKLDLSLVGLGCDDIQQAAEALKQLSSFAYAVLRVETEVPSAILEALSDVPELYDIKLWYTSESISPETLESNMVYLVEHCSELRLLQVHCRKNTTGQTMNGKTIINAMTRNYRIKWIDCENKGVWMPKEAESTLEIVARLNRHGRIYMQDDKTNVEEGYAVLEEVNNCLDCLFFHLRENPELCSYTIIQSNEVKPPRKRRRGRAKKGW
jgi:hypothetical protein